MKSRNTKIIDFAAVTAGSTPSRGNKSYFNGVIPWVKTLDLNFGIVVETEEKISTAAFTSIRGGLNPPGTVMIAMYGGAGTIGKSGVLGIEASTNQAIASILPQPNTFDSSFLHYQLMHLRPEWMQYSQGNRKDPNISKAVIENMLVWFPSIDEQRRIAAHLKAQLAAVEEARQAAQAQLRDARKLIPAILEAEFARLANAPKVRIGDVANTTSGSTPLRDRKDYWHPPQIAWVKTGEIAFTPIHNTEEKISEKALFECSLSLLPAESVLVAMYGQGKTRGQSALLKIAATINQACFAILPNDTFHSEYLQLWLRHSYDNLRSQSEDRGGNQSNLNGAILNAFEVPITSLAEQSAIAERLHFAIDEATRLQTAVEHQLREIELLPSRLLAQAFEN